MRAVVSESNQRRPGGEAVLERMSEMLFVEVVRRYADSLPPERDRVARGDAGRGRRPRARAHAREARTEAWTLERLGEEAGLSRSSLHERFVHFIGQPPMQYLTQWRMQLAAGLLRDTSAKVVDVAQRVGYESEAAFSRAFKRVVGVAPGGWRRGERGTQRAPAERPRTSETRRAALVSRRRRPIESCGTRPRATVDDVRSIYASAMPSRMCSGSTRYSGAYSPSRPASDRSMTSSGIRILR